MPWFSITSTGLSTTHPLYTPSHTRYQHTLSPHTPLFHTLSTHLRNPLNNLTPFTPSHFHSIDIALLRELTRLMTNLSAVHENHPPLIGVGVIDCLVKSAHNRDAMVIHPVTAPSHVLLYTRSHTLSHVISLPSYTPSRPPSRPPSHPPTLRRYRDSQRWAWSIYPPCRTTTAT